MLEPLETGPACGRWLDQLAGELERLEGQGLKRVTRAVQGAIGPEVVIDGRRLILAAANDYLGLAGDPEVIEAAVEAARSHGAGAGAARLISGTFDLDHRLEAELAGFKGTEAALVFSTGYLANLGVVTALTGPGDAIFSDQLNHASIVDGCRLSKAERFVFGHGDVDHLDRLLTEHGSRFRRRLIVTDGVFSMDGDLAPLPELASLARRHEAMLVVDDAHATGVIGPNGGGSLDHFGLKDDRIIQIGTMSKALGCLGGFAAGPAVVIDYLRNTARPFFYTTALPPAVLGAALKALDIVRRRPERRERVLALARKLRAELTGQGWSVPVGETPIVPVIIGDSQDALAASARLNELGIMIPAIRPPTVAPGTARLRIALSAGHTDQHLARIVEAFRTLKEEMGL